MRGADPEFDVRGGHHFRQGVWGRLEAPVGHSPYRGQGGRMPSIFGILEIFKGKIKVLKFRL